VSLNVLGTISLAAEGGEGEGFHAPTPAEFYQPLIGHGDFAITRPMVVLAISVGLIAWFLVSTTKRAAVVSVNGQAATENGRARHQWTFCS